MSLKNTKSYYQKFYRTIDGPYSSFWAGKFENQFIKSGKKGIIKKQLKQVYFYSKTQLNKLPLRLLLENLIKIKPIFNLGVIVIRGKERRYPVLLKRHKQLILVIQWVSKLIINRREWYLGQRIYNELVDILTNKKHSLLQKRREIFKLTVKNRFNLRYSR